MDVTGQLTLNGIFEIIIYINLYLLKGYAGYQMNLNGTWEQSLFVGSAITLPVQYFMLFFGRLLAFRYQLYAVQLFGAKTKIQYYNSLNLGNQDIP